MTRYCWIEAYKVQPCPSACSGNVQKTKEKFSFDSCALSSNEHQTDHCALEDIDMSRKIETGTDYRKKAGLAVVAMFLATASIAAVAEVQGSDSESQEQRSSESLHFSRGGRANNRDPDKATLSVDQYDALTREGTRSKSVTKPLSSESTSGSSQSITHDFWIYYADVELFYDDDGDGFYYGIDLLFDADTIYSSADVYAAVYLSYEGGPWNEYAVTEDFTIFGESGGDEYVLVTELMSGYPTGEYDLLIELFDAYDGVFIASLGPEDTSELAYLRLEDFNRDAPIVEDRVVVTHGGGGAIGIWLLLALAAGRMIRQ
jgi:hypothetical protein